MNYLQYYPVDVVNGVGTRCTLFVSGCEHFCKGCHNSSTWDARKGRPFTEEMVEQILEDLADSRIYHDGLSLSGGDPLYPGNLDDILHLVKCVKEQHSDKDIWMWTGYRWEELSPQQKVVVSYVDVLIDGRYEEDKRDLTLAWRGSANQRIIWLNKGKPDHIIEQSA